MRLKCSQHRGEWGPTWLGKKGNSYEKWGRVFTTRFWIARDKRAWKLEGNHSAHVW